MSLESTLADIVTKLREGRFPNEAAISTGIVLRVLRALNWQDHDTQVVWPEYNVGKGRVDFALCDPPSKPRVFVEVKQPGAAQSEDAIEQAMLYAYRQGVAIVVVTDGRTWSFYLPAEQGSYEERRVLMLDLYESSSRDSGDALVHYLEHRRVASGEALEAARREYRNRTSRDTARRTLPEAWSKLVRDRNEVLVRLLADAVEAQIKIRPDDEDVAEFLGSSKDPLGLPSASLISDSSESQESPNPAIIVAGIRHEFKSRVKAMVIALTELQKADRGFLDRLAIYPGIKRPKRMVIAKSSADIYPDSPHLRNRVAQLPNGWLVCTNFSAQEVIQVVKIAEVVSGKAVDWDLTADTSQSDIRSIKRPVSKPTGRKNQSDPDHHATGRIRAFTIEGKRHGYRNGTEAVEIILTELQNANNRFLDELAEHPNIRGRKRALVARSAEEIFPDTPHLRHRVGQLPGGWLFCKNLSSKTAMRIIDASIELSKAHLTWDPPIKSD